ncbi:hypothetical protein MMC07_009570 [Pseudocyphellaria aurata]|nr:hypothetical protein [Pseudocyphellaria aurata]
MVTVDVTLMVVFRGSTTLTPVQFNVRSGGPMNGSGFGMMGKNPEGPGMSDSVGNVSDGRPLARDAPGRVSFNCDPLGFEGLPDMITVGTSPFVPRRWDVLFFSSEPGTRSVGVGFEVSGPNEELLLPTGTETAELLLLFGTETAELLLLFGTETAVGRSVGSTPVPELNEELPSLTGLDTIVNEPVRFLGVSTTREGAVAIDSSPPPTELVGREGAVAIDSSPPPTESVGTEEAAGTVVNGGLDEERVGTIVNGGLDEEKVGTVVNGELDEEMVGTVVNGELDEERVGMVVNVELDEERVGTAETLVTFWNEFCRRKRTRMFVSR